MNLVHLLPVGTSDGFLLEDLRAALAKRLPVRCQILPAKLDPTPLPTPRAPAVPLL